MQSCVGNLEEAGERERAAREADPATGSGETYSNFTLTGQVSHAKTAQSISNIDRTRVASDREKGSKTVIVGWACPDDPQVRIF